MKEKVINLIIGSLLVISLTSPPQFINFFILDLSDLTIVLLFIFLLVNIIEKNSLNNIYSLFKNSYWFYTTMVFVFSFFLYGMNTLTIRFIFYTILGFVFFIYIHSISITNLEYVFLPFFGITFLNFVTFVMELSFVENTLGWISFFYENPNFFNRGRLAGFQGGGPNVAGLLFVFLTFINYYFFINSKKFYYLALSFLNLFLVFVTFSRGSWLAFFIPTLFFLFYKKLNKKTILFGAFTGISLIVLLLNITNPQILLKESDRGYLTNIALENISLVKGYGGGNYVNQIYGQYFLSIDPKILEENLNIKLDKVELGITPEEYRNSGINFYIGTSGGGYELLQQANIAEKCSEDRITCQHVRVNQEILIRFISSIFDSEIKETENLLNNSECINTSKVLKTRGEFYCFLDKNFMILSQSLNDSSLKREDLFVECEISKTYLCENRELAIGELSVLVEKLVYGKNLISEENFKKFCTECEFRNVSGFIKISFDKRDGILPRSKFSFFTSPNGEIWEQVGFSRTTGNIISFIPNYSFVEIGGHSDGQSFGNTFLDGNIKSLKINSNQTSNEIKFNEENQNNTFFVFNPNSDDLYTSKITYETNGIKLFRPNKYWLAIENIYDFNQDFEIILEVSLPEIPWETNTLISNTSIFNSQTQSWRIDIDDGRIFFSWTNENGVFVQDNVIGDKSLRSGILIQENGMISSAKSPIVDPSYLSQLTTAHNGYLTFAVEYGLLISLIFFGIIFLFVFNIFKTIDDKNIILFLCLLAFLIQNLTNDMLYSADIFVLFNIIFSVIYYFVTPLSDKKA